LPYDGLFGDSNLIRVIRQVIADPFTEYRPHDLEILTKNSMPTVRNSLKILTSLGLLIKDESDHQHPLYKVNTESKRYIALTFLAYAILDDKNGTNCMDNVVVDYCSELMEKSEPRGREWPEIHMISLETIHSEVVSPSLPLADAPIGGASPQSEDAFKGISGSQRQELIATAA